jgi:hypothetical protein
MKQTAVEWLENEIIDRDLDIVPNIVFKLIKQAKEMEKTEKHAEYMRGWKDGYSCKKIKNKIK